MWWPLNSNYVLWEKNLKRQKQGGRIVLFLILANIFQGQCRLFFFSFCEVAPKECWALKDKRTLQSSFLVLSTWQNQIICTDQTGILPAFLLKMSVSLSVFCSLVLSPRHSLMYWLHGRTATRINTYSKGHFELGEGHDNDGSVGRRALSQDFCLSPLFAYCLMINRKPLLESRPVNSVLISFFFYLSFSFALT